MGVSPRLQENCRNELLGAARARVSAHAGEAVSISSTGFFPVCAVVILRTVQSNGAFGGKTTLPHHHLQNRVRCFFNLCS